MIFAVYIFGICLCILTIGIIIKANIEDREYRKKGIETEAIAIRTIPCRISRNPRRYSGIYYKNFAQYVGDDNKVHEALIINCGYKRIKYNTKVSIKYIPRKYEKCIGFDL